MQDNYNRYDPYGTTGNGQRVGEVNQAVISKTFAFMSAALVISAFFAFYTYGSDFVYTMLSDRMMIYGLLFAEIGVVIAANFALTKHNALLAAVLLIVYAAVNGVTLSTVFVIYELESIASIFIVAAIVFAVMAVYGYVTKSDLTKLGSIGMMALIGVIVLGFANIFIKSSGLDLLVAIVALAIFIGLTAYDMQKLKQYASADMGQSTNIVAMFCALQLYLDFINIFLRLLQLFGKRK